MDQATAPRILHLLQRHREPAHPLSSILPLLDGELVRPPRSSRELLQLLKSRPDLFRVLEPPTPALGTDHARVREGGVQPIQPLTEPWVVPLGPAPAPWPSEEPEDRVRRILLESLRCLSVHLDPRSRPALYRWARMMAEFRRIRLNPGSGGVRSTTPPPGPHP